MLRYKKSAEQSTLLSASRHQTRTALQDTIGGTKFVVYILVRAYYIKKWRINAYLRPHKAEQNVNPQQASQSAQAGEEW